MAMLTDYVVPGKIIGQLKEGYDVGEGAYVIGNDIISSVAGKLEVRKQFKDDTKTIVINVINPKSVDLVPEVGKLVTGQVVRITHKYCQCRILMVDTTILRNSFTGYLRKEDVTMTDKDKVEMDSCFKIGDHIVARVISMDNMFGFLLSTAENELGVVVAMSEEGVPMQPVSHKEMRCPKTGVTESRKVACPQKRYIRKPNK